MRVSTRSTTEEHHRGAPAAPEEQPSTEHDAAEMIRGVREKWLWTNWTNVALGIWLITSPATFGYDQRAVIWSDTVSGFLLVVFAALALWPRPRNDFWGRWGACFVGLWLQFAPLVFWASSAAMYVNDTLVGALAIALSVLVPTMPGMAHHMAMMKAGPEVPPGWTYNPSTWHQRAPIIALGFIGWFISRYLAAVQLGYIPAAWEPFFGAGTQRVLHSEVSRMWPISDAGLGATAYTLETLMGFMGNQTRWRTMPWMVTFFGILVVPLGVTHIVLVILQPVVVGEWCTLCLAAATVMLVMIPLTLDEVVAMLQFLVLAHRDGKPLWRTFWVGDTITGGARDTRTPRYGAPTLALAPATVWGVKVPWPLAASILAGTWLIFAPSFLGTGGALADSDHLSGALMVTIAAIATAEVARTLRLANVAVGMWVIAAPFLLDTTGAGMWNDIAVGAFVVALSLPRGRLWERYGPWDRYVV